MNKKLVAFLLAVSMSVGMVGCGSTSSSDTASTSNKSSEDAENTGASSNTTTATENAGKDTLTVAIPGDPATFAPNDTFSQWSMQATYAIYDRLFYETKDGEIVYSCAENVEQEDSTHILLTLKEGVTDTNGNELTSSDILFDIERLQSTMFTSMFDKIDIDSCEAIDDYNVKLTLSSPYAIQLNILQNIQLVDEDSFNASDDGMTLSPVGYGPYYLDSYTAGAEYKLVARDDYWGDTPQIQEITAKFISEGSQRTNALISGDVDMAIEVLINDADYIDENDGTYINSRETFVSNGLIFNCSEVSACSDEHLRKAIAYAIDEASILNVVYKGTAKQAMAAFSTGCTDYDEEAWNKIAEKYDNYYDYNIEKAKEELAKSSMPNGGTIKGVHYSADCGDSIAELVQAMLSEIGITLEITACENATINAMLVNEPEKWDIEFAGWYAGAPFSSEIANVHVLGNNFCNWSGDDYDEFAEAVNAAEYADSQEECVEKCQDVIDISSKYLPYYSIADVNYLVGCRDGLNMAYFGDQIFDYSHMTWS